MTENILSIVIMSILIIWVITDIMLDRVEKRTYVVCALLVIVVVLAEMYCHIHDNTSPDSRIKSIIGNMMGFGLSPFIFVFVASLYSKKDTYINFIPAIVNLLIALLSPITGWIFFVDQDCSYSRGPLFFLFILVFAFSVVLSLVAKIRSFRFLPEYFKRRTILSCGINSMVDGLTGLLNKTVFNKQMNLFHITERSDHYLLLMDVNDFKKVNDTKGHMYGDQCLCEIASIIKGVFKKQANFFRFGGDEFCVLMKAESDETVEKYIQSLMHAFLGRREESGFFPEIAVGYAKFQAGVSSHEIVDLTDFNMYACKKQMKENTAFTK